MHPADRYAELVEDPTAFRNACDRPLPSVVRVNTLRATPRDVINVLEASDVRVTQRDWSPNVLEVSTDEPGNSWPYVLGWMHGQEEVSQVPAIVLDPQPGDRILDMAAAPGGKATQLAARQDGDGLVVANDVNLGRLASLRTNGERLGITNLAVTRQDGRVFSVGPFDFEQFDRVLVDAPCSGEGTIRKNPDVQEGVSEGSREHLATLQEGLLRRAVELTVPSGVVVYGTCTFAPEENEAVVSRILATEDCTIERADLALEHRPGVTRWQGSEFDPRVERAQRFYPHETDSGGFFCAKLRVGA